MSFRDLIGEPIVVRMTGIDTPPSSSNVIRSSTMENSDARSTTVEDLDTQPCTTAENHTILTCEEGNLSISDHLRNSLYACKSTKVYDKWHDRFSAWCKGNKSSESISSVLEFLNQMKSVYAVTTLWQAYSCLNKYYTIYHGWKPFSNYPVIKDFLKKLEKGHDKKKSQVFSQEQVSKFLSEFSEESSGLVKKCVMIMGYFGGMRISELTDLTFENVENKENHFVVNIAGDKTDPSGSRHFNFVISSSTSNSFYCPVKMVV